MGGSEVVLLQCFVLLFFFFDNYVTSFFEL